MSIILDIDSSVRFWRLTYPGNRAPKAALTDAPQWNALKRGEAAAACERFGIDNLRDSEGRMHFLGFERSSRRSSSTYAVHAWGGPVPPGSFYELQEGLFVESPSFMFLQAASILSLHKLIAFGDELVGLYSFNPNAKRGFTKRTVPLENKKHLETYLGSVGVCRGRTRALQALPHIVERSASPMETYDEATMCLPYRYGGYGVYKPTMNLPLMFNDRAARIAKRKNAYLDMGWEGVKLDVEHHGKYDHESSEAVISDRARVNAIEEMGYEVIELTGELVGNVMAYEYIVERIARLVGKRIDRNRLGYLPQRLELRRELSFWNSSSGAIRQSSDS